MGHVIQTGRGISSSTPFCLPYVIILWTFFFKCLVWCRFSLDRRGTRKGKDGRSRIEIRDKVKGQRMSFVGRTVYPKAGTGVPSRRTRLKRRLVRGKGRSPDRRGDQGDTNLVEWER